MGVIESNLKNILTFSVRRATRDAINYGTNREEIKDMNREQLNKGLKATSGDMPKYTQFSMRNKPAQFIPPNKSYSLKNTGKLHSLIYVDAGMTSMVITSVDSEKNKKLQNDGFGGVPVSEEEAFGLTEKNREVLKVKILLPFMEKRLRGQV